LIWKWSFLTFYRGKTAIWIPKTAKNKLFLLLFLFLQQKFGEFMSFYIGKVLKLGQFWRINIKIRKIFHLFCKNNNIFANLAIFRESEPYAFCTENTEYCVFYCCDLLNRSHCLVNMLLLLYFVSNQTTKRAYPHYAYVYYLLLCLNQNN